MIERTWDYDCPVPGCGGVHVDEAPEDHFQLLVRAHKLRHRPVGERLRAVADSLDARGMSGDAMMLRNAVVEIQGEVRRVGVSVLLHNNVGSSMVSLAIQSLTCLTAELALNEADLDG